MSTVSSDRLLLVVREELQTKKDALVAAIVDGSLPSHARYLQLCAELKAMDEVFLTIIDTNTALKEKEQD